jgi:hypothetical protein
MVTSRAFGFTEARFPVCEALCQAGIQQAFIVKNALSAEQMYIYKVFQKYVPVSFFGPGLKMQFLAFKLVPRSLTEIFLKRLYTGHISLHYHVKFRIPFHAKLTRLFVSLYVKKLERMYSVFSINLE